MILFHGSNTDINDIDLNMCRPFKDFGRGFYLTTIKEQAVNMAKRVSRIYGGDPMVNIFEFNIESAYGMNIKEFSQTSAEWAIFVMNNRSRGFTDNDSDACNNDSKYDIVIGPVADDGLTALIETYAHGLADIEKIVSKMRYKNVSDQYSFHTERAVRLLKKVGVENV
ncbi:MAG: DUF3990 domain-containing protein [Clostridia bacterium]|nr:DUF3990 domain-containing protein [Clostridia bacterium]